MKLRRPYRRRRSPEIGFAWRPKRLLDGTWIWLERYRRTRQGRVAFSQKEEPTHV